MMNLAFFGFTIAGVLFVIYALSFYWWRLKNDTLKRNCFAAAYFMTGLMFATWGMAVQFFQDRLPSAILLGNVFLVAASVLMLNVFAGSKKQRLIVNVSGIIFGLVFIWVRWRYFLPEPKLVDGVLLLNTQPLISFFWMAIFAFVWLPADFEMAKLAAETVKLASMKSAFRVTYGVSVFSAIVFMSASTPKMAILSFAFLCFCFVMLLLSNVYLKKAR